MTALNIATQIPSNIVTLEQLAVWLSNCLTALNTNVTATEGVNYAVNAASSGTFYIAAADTTRHVGRQSIALDPSYLIGGAKPWMYAQELSSKVLTAAMTTN
jgi:hypothetical protein